MVRDLRTQVSPSSNGVLQSQVKWMEFNSLIGGLVLSRVV